MNILKTLFAIFVFLVILKMILDFFSINLNTIEGMQNKEEDCECEDEKEQIPKAHPHMAQNKGRNVSNSEMSNFVQGQGNQGIARRRTFTYVAQEIPKIDVEIVAKGHLWVETNH